MKTSKTNQVGAKQSNPFQSKAKNQGNAGSILQAYKNRTAQLQPDEEKETVQGKFETAQLNAEEEEGDAKPVQRKEIKARDPMQFKRLIKGFKTRDTSFKRVSDFVKDLRGKAYAKSDEVSHDPHGGNLEKHRDQGESREDALNKMYNTAKATKIEEVENELTTAEASKTPNQKKIAQLKPKNETGLPDNLKAGVENLSGYNMDDVKVHYNSSKPAALQAHAYAQGTDIHLASGQEKHLAHEAWHVAQQKQGRVKPTTQMKGDTPVNDDDALENEADVMGAKALELKSSEMGSVNNAPDQPKKTAVNPTKQLKTIIHNETQDVKQKYNNAPTVKATVGKRMKAYLDPTDPKKGSSPGSGAQFEIYKDLNNENDKQYIKGHMLNANLGGLGITENLFPITADANHEHSGSVEENVKQAMLLAYNPFSKTKNYDIEYEVNSVIDGNPNRFVFEPDSHLDCSAKKVYPDKSEEQIVNRKIDSKSGFTFSKNDLLKVQGWGSSGAGYGGSKTGAVGEVSDAKAIKNELSTAGITITGGTVDKVIKRSGKFHSIIFK